MGKRKKGMGTRRQREGETEVMADMKDFYVASGVGNFLEPFASDMESLMSSEASTGYLQDAVVEWSQRCKRLRTMSSCGFIPPAATEVAEDVQELLQGFWGSNCAGNISGDLDSFFQETSFVAEKQFKWREETEEAAQQQLSLSSSPASSSHANCYYAAAAAENFSNKKGSDSLAMKQEEEEESRRRKKKKVAYPFAVLRPAGIVEGNVTLAEINERILMRPTRSVRHPVGKFACMPCVPDAGGGPGLSGKAVVGLTRIHTQGRGTITIIRTRG